jgi:tRNA(fMet)-specific endonuclease VapC
MKRYLLDTNILIFLLMSELDNITKVIKEILDDYDNQIGISTISVIELMQLYNIGKIKSKKYKNATELLNAIENDYYIKILPFTKEHTKTLAKLSIVEGHNDPFDHAIIAQSISENLQLVSSDRKFKSYTNQKLQFCFNKR